MIGIICISTDAVRSDQSRSCGIRFRAVVTDLQDSEETRKVLQNQGSGASSLWVSGHAIPTPHPPQPNCSSGLRAGSDSRAIRLSMFAASLYSCFRGRGTVVPLSLALALYASIRAAILAERFTAAPNLAAHPKLRSPQPSRQTLGTQRHWTASQVMGEFLPRFFETGCGRIKSGVRAPAQDWMMFAEGC